LSEYKSGDPQRGLAFVPRRGINVHENEVMRAYKTVNDSYIEPISFVVPRRAEVFQSDIYPPATGLKPGVSAADWLAGKTALPPKIDLESVYEGNAPVEVPADYKPPTPAAAPMATKPMSPIKKEPEPAPAPAATQRAPPPTLTEQKGSIAAMASKFQDHEDEEDEDDASSFEEIAKPIVRPTTAAKAQPKPSSPVAARSSAPTSAPAPLSPVAPRATQAPAPTPPHATTATSSAPISAAAAPPVEFSNSSVEASLMQIKSLLEQQTKTIAAQSEKIGLLAADVDSLKMKVGSGNQDQSERIRELELELEAARS